VFSISKAVLLHEAFKPVGEHAACHDSNAESLLYPGERAQHPACVRRKTTGESKLTGTQTVPKEGVQNLHVDRRPSQQVL